MTRDIARRFSLLAVLAGAALALAACGSDDGNGGGGGADAEGPLLWDARSVQDSVEGVPFVPSVINSSLGMGENRVAIALVNREDSSLVPDASITATFYRLGEDPEAEPEVAEAVTSEQLRVRTLDLNVEHLDEGEGEGDDQGARQDADGVWPAANLPSSGTQRPGDPHEGDLTTVYTANANFEQSGHWGVALEVSHEGQTYHPRLTFWVLEATSEPAIGDPAPRSEQVTLADVSDATEVSSEQDPQEGMLDQTVAQALETGKPVVVAFVTPAFCQTRFCGPVMEAVVEPAYAAYGDRVEFVHIEPYDLEKARNEGVLEPVPAVQEWGLRSEPFIFVVDSEGIIQAKLEGITDEAELTEAIESVLNPA